MKFFTKLSCVLLTISIGSGTADSSESQISECARALADPTGHTDDYIRFACRAERDLREGKLTEARDASIKALAEHLVEVPNYALIVQLAEIECLRGKSTQGRYLLNELECMMDVEIGRRQCFAPTTDPTRLGPVPNDVTLMCFDRMCGELYLDYYVNPTAATLRHIAALRVGAKRVEDLCRGGGRVHDKR